MKIKKKQKIYTEDTEFIIKNINFNIFYYKF